MRVMLYRRAMTQFRYRKLTATRDAEAVQFVYENDARSRSLKLSDRRWARADAENEAPQQVHADEAQASFHELVRQLNEGELNGSDLVFSNGAWTTFATAPEFYEVIAGEEEAAEHESRNGIRNAILIALPFAALFFYLLFKR
jgi:hypothetical protein